MVERKSVIILLIQPIFVSTWVLNSYPHQHGKHLKISMFLQSSININESMNFMKCNCLQSSSDTYCWYISYMLWQGYQGISWPSQAKNLPLSWIFTLLIMLSSFWTENSLVKSFSGGTFLWNGLERSVSTVPGCSKMHTIGSFFLANSRETVFDTVIIKRERDRKDYYFKQFVQFWNSFTNA